MALDRGMLFKGVPQPPCPEAAANLIRTVGAPSAGQSTANNMCAAGIAYKGNVFGAEEAQTTLATNFAGTRAVCERLAPLIPEGVEYLTCVSPLQQLMIKNLFWRLVTTE
jgi:hypothetical protein